MDRTDINVETILGDAFREAHGLDQRPADEQGEFAIRTVYLDGVERLGTEFTSLRAALAEADRVRADHHAHGHSRSTVHVDVIDLDDGERRLDWDTLED